jgi:hypothetical protein
MGRRLRRSGSPFSETDAQFSPDGKWIAYQSNESGRVEIYVTQFPPPLSGPGGSIEHESRDVRQTQRMTASAVSWGMVLKHSFACGAFACTTLISFSKSKKLEGMIRMPPPIMTQS